MSVCVFAPSPSRLGLEAGTIRVPKPALRCYERRVLIAGGLTKLQRAAVLLPGLFPCGSAAPRHNRSPTDRWPHGESFRRGAQPNISHAFFCCVNDIIARRQDRSCRSFPNEIEESHENESLIRSAGR